MENQHRKITGYRELSKSEIDLMNRIKAHGEASAALIKEVSELRETMNKELKPSLSPAQFGESMRCLALAKTHLQTGQMWFVRSVALPDSF